MHVRTRTYVYEYAGRQALHTFILSLRCCPPRPELHAGVLPVAVGGPLSRPLRGDTHTVLPSSFLAWLPIVRSDPST